VWCLQVACDDKERQSQDAQHWVDANASEGSATHADESDAGASAEPVRVQVFSRTQGYRHESIAAGLAMFETFDQQEDLSVQSTEDPVRLVERLSETDVVVFLSTTGDVLDAVQEDALESFIRAGGGFVGVHAAADTEYDWPFYGELLGARFTSHPDIQPARVIVEAPRHPATSFLPAVWERTDEWYNFDRNPRDRVEVLLSLDETSYAGGTHGADHPIAWCQTVGQGRSFFTALGHTSESWSDSAFQQHIEQAVRWAAQRLAREQNAANASDVPARD
jgi:type 1 glutamine amidotransferase